MKKALYFLSIVLLSMLVLVSCTKKEDKILEIIQEPQQTAAVAAPVEEAPVEATPAPQAKRSEPAKTDKLTGLTFSNRKDTYAAYDEKEGVQREKMGPAAYPNGSEYDRFQEIILDFMGTRRQAGYDYLISFSFLEDGYVEVCFGGEYMYGYYTIDGNKIYTDNGNSLLGILSDDGYSLENKLVEGTLYLELPVVGTFTNSNDMMMDYLALFNEEMKNNNITSYEDEVFTDWFMLTYGNVDEYTEKNAVTATFLENGFVYILKDGTSKYSQYTFDEENKSYILVDGVPMFAIYEGGYELKPLFQHSLMRRIEMPEETKKYL